MRAAAFFPPVKQDCTACQDGKLRLADSRTIDCPNCDGKGFTIREMDAREEHWYLMYLINGIDRRTQQ